MNTTETIIFITGIVGIALALVVLLIIIQLVACDNCPYKDVCKNNSDNKEFTPPCKQNIDINNNNMDMI